MKRTIAIVVALLMVMALIPVTAGARVNDNTFKPVKRDILVEAARLEQTREAMRDDVVVINGDLLDCSFESTEDLSAWWMSDRDGDGYNWGFYSAGADYAKDGSTFAWSRSYTQSTGDLTPDNWLVTPEITIPSDGQSYYLSYYVRSLQATWPDSVQVLISEEGEGYELSDHSITPDGWETIVDVESFDTEEYVQRYVDITAYAGRTVSVAFRHNSSGMNALMLDYIQVGTMGELIDVTGVTLSAETLALEVTGSSQLTATVVPSNATYQSVTWSTSDASVALVNNIGGVMAMGAGTATITATAQNGVSASCTVTVSEGSTFETEYMLGFAMYDHDASGYSNNWYWVAETGLLELAQEGDTTYYSATWHPVDQVIYAYAANGSTYDFVSIDPFNEFTVTTIASGLAQAADWMSYGFDTGVMYGGFYGVNSSNYYTNYYLATVNLETGAMDEVLVDTYTATDSNGDQLYMLPSFGTYAGGGMFIAADINYGELLMYAPNYTFSDGSTGFAYGYASDYSASEMFNGGVGQYFQCMYYNPFDGMLYWACNDSAGLHMAVYDLATGIGVDTGTLGDENASVGMIMGSMFVLYEENQSDYLWGDANCDGEVSFSDVSAMYFFCAGTADLTEQGQINADVDEDGDVTFADVSVLALYLAGN